MTGRAINAKSEALKMRNEELDAVSGGMIYLPLIAFSIRQPAKEPAGQNGQNDPAQMFQQIMQQLTGG